MATEILQKQGTDVVWTSSGGDETFTLTSLANGAGRAGDEHDFGGGSAPFPARVRVELELDFNVAPTAGNTVDVYWASSKDGTDYDGEMTGSDSALSTNPILKRLHLVGSLVCTNDTDPQRQSWVFYLPARYGLPVVWNASGQALTATGTDQILTVTPLIDEAQ